MIWGDEAEVRSFEDRWSGGIQHYIGWMQERVTELHRILKPTGSLYLHCDSHASHYLRIMLDTAFGMANFRNEIIWRRTGANKSVSRFGPIHQTLLFYGKSSAAKFNVTHTPYTRDYVDGQFRLEDERGRFRPVLLTGPGRRDGDSGLPWRGHDPTAGGRHWQPSSYLYAKYQEITGDDLAKFPLLERLDHLDEIGMIYWGESGDAQPNYRWYLDDAPGAPMQDIWSFTPGTKGCLWNGDREGIDEDIKWLGANDAERLGYPTQKPVGLLERIIRSSSNTGDIVLDPFCGCGTTIVAAHRLDREWIEIDISPTAMEIMRRRLWNESRYAPTIVNMPSDEEALRKLKPFEFQNWIINTMNGTHSPRKSRDGGIDGYSFFSKDPIQVKQSTHPIGRVIVDEFQTAMRRGGHDVGYIVGFSFTKDAVEEVARVKADDGVTIKLVRVKEVLLLAKRPDSPPKVVGPQPEGEVLPLPPMRKKTDLPTPEELVESDKSAAS